MGKKKCYFHWTLNENWSFCLHQRDITPTKCVKTYMILESKLEMGKWAIVFICNIINYSDDCLEIPLRLETILFCETNLTCHKPSLRDLSNEKPPSFWETTLTCHNPSLRDLSNEIPPSFWKTTLTCHNPSLRDLSNEIPPSFLEDHFKMS